MPRTITMAGGMKQSIQNDFTALLCGIKMTDGKIKYTKSFSYKDEKATVFLTPVAYQKTLTLVAEFSDEVAWHAVVNRLSDREFIIEDILVYPQEVSGSTVNTDQEEYTKWLYALDDEVFSKIRMQIAPTLIWEFHHQE